MYRERNKTDMGWVRCGDRGSGFKHKDGTQHRQLRGHLQGMTITLAGFVEVLKASNL